MHFRSVCRIRVSVRSNDDLFQELSDRAIGATRHMCLVRSRFLTRFVDCHIHLCLNSHCSQIQSHPSSCNGEHKRNECAMDKKSQAVLQNAVLEMADTYQSNRPMSRVDEFWFQRLQSFNFNKGKRIATIQSLRSSVTTSSGRFGSCLRINLSSIVLPKQFIVRDILTRGTQCNKCTDFLSQLNIDFRYFKAKSSGLAVQPFSRFTITFRNT